MHTAICAVVAGVVLAASVAADARGRDRFAFKVDLARGKARRVIALTLPAAALTAQRVKPPLYASYDKKGVVSVRTAQQVPQLTLTVGTRQYEWMPWSLFQPGLLVFAWREIIVVPGQRDAYRDVIRSVDLATGTELWRRDTVDAIAAAIGDRLLLVNTGTAFELVDSGTGKTVRTVAFTGGGPRPLAIAGGDTLIDTGEVLARLDSTGAIGWQAKGLGAVISVTPLAEPLARYRWEPGFPASPLPTTGDWLVLTTARLVRLSPSTGKVVWSMPSTSTSLLVDATEVITTDVAPQPTTGPTVKLIRSDLATGKTLRAVPLVTYPYTIEQTVAVVHARRGNLVEVTAEFIVWD